MLINVYSFRLGHIIYTCNGPIQPTSTLTITEYPTAQLKIIKPTFNFHIIYEDSVPRVVKQLVLA